jgi:hypothetical protein
MNDWVINLPCTMDYVVIKLLVCLCIGLTMDVKWFSLITSMPCNNGDAWLV